MEFLTCVVAAEEDEYPEIAGSSSPLNAWSGIEMPGLDTVRLATLHSLLTGDSLQMAPDLYEPDELQFALAALSELAQLAESQGQALFVWIRLLQD